MFFNLPKQTKFQVLYFKEDGSVPNRPSNEVKRQSQGIDSKKPEVQPPKDFAKSLRDKVSQKIDQVKNKVDGVIKFGGEVASNVGEKLAYAKEFLQEVAPVAASILGQKVAEIGEKVGINKFLENRRESLNDTKVKADNNRAGLKSNAESTADGLSSNLKKAGKRLEVCKQMLGLMQYLTRDKSPIVSQTLGFMSGKIEDVSNTLNKLAQNNDSQARQNIVDKINDIKGYINMMKGVVKDNFFAQIALKMFEKQLENTSKLVSENQNQTRSGNQYQGTESARAGARSTSDTTQQNQAKSNQAKSTDSQPRNQETKSSAETLSGFESKLKNMTAGTVFTMTNDRGKMQLRKDEQGNFIVTEGQGKGSSTSLDKLVENARRTGNIPKIQVV